jgi:hypothetical protein
MELEELPRHLLIIGGGYVGLEFAQMFKRFGSQVSIFARGGQLLGREDPDVAAEIANVLEKDGIKVCLDSTITTVSKRVVHCNLSYWKSVLIRVPKTKGNEPGYKVSRIEGGRSRAVAGYAPQRHSSGTYAQAGRGVTGS